MSDSGEDGTRVGPRSPDTRGHAVTRATWIPAHQTLASDSASAPVSGADPIPHLRGGLAQRLALGSEFVSTLNIDLDAGSSDRHAAADGGRLAARALAVEVQGSLRNAVRLGRSFVLVSGPDGQLARETLGWQPNHPLVAPESTR
jgi:hypothetical protein